MIESSLKWNRQIELLAERNFKLIALMRKLIGLTGGLKLKFRLLLHNQLHLSTMLYCSDVWGEQLNQQQKNRLHSMQRTAILSLTGAYHSTNNAKLLDLLGLLEVNEEIGYRQQTRALDSVEKKRNRLELIAMRRLDEQPYGSTFECNLSESTGRSSSF